VSMLCLDAGGAFDNVSHERLLWILRVKGFPDWVIQTIQSFLTARRTRIAYAGHESEWISTQTGIPQGSPISPILFLIFITELLETFQSPAGETIALGFVDDTNLITCGDTAANNCRKLEAAHDKCIAWAKRHGARFAPLKYQLIHFTKRRRDPGGDLASRIRLDAHTVQPETSLIVLGIHVDKELSWRAHVKQATNKGLAAYKALARISASTWGPSFASARLIYSAVVRPTMMYGAQVWGVRNDGEPATATLLQPLRTVQNKCLRNITGAYRRTPTAAIERETDIPPIDLHVDKVATQHAGSTRTHPVTRAITTVTDEIWNSMSRPPARDTRPARPHNNRRRQRRGTQITNPRPPSPMEALRARAESQEWQIRQQLAESERATQRTRRRTAPAPQPNQNQKRSGTILKLDLYKKWKQRWRRRAGGKQATTWKAPWRPPATKAYDSLLKHEATVLFLLRTEIIGLNSWLYSVNVPAILLPRCACGWHEQTVRHVMIYCPLYTSTRAELFRRAGSIDLQTMLSTPRGAKAAARWLIARGTLPQFTLAKDIAQEDTSRYQQAQGLDTWS
jgi:hypothetical protein